MMATTEIGNLQANRMAVDQLGRFFKFDLVFRVVAQLKRTLQGGLTFGLNDVVTAVCLVHEHTQALWRDFDNTATDSKVIELAIGVTLICADGNRSRHRKAYEWFVTGKNSDLTGSSRQNHLVDIFVYFRSQQCHQLEIHGLVFLLA